MISNGTTTVIVSNGHEYLGKITGVFSDSMDFANSCSQVVLWDPHLGHAWQLNDLIRCWQLSLRMFF